MMPRQQLEELKDRVSLKIYQRYATLKLEDKTYVGRCPLHHEDTGSFKVDRRGQKGEVWPFFCHGGCKRGGDIVRLLQLKENITVPQAIAKLVEEDGGAVPNQDYREKAKQVDSAFKPVTPKEEKKTIPLEKYLKSVEALLNCPDALRFLHEQRGITAATAERLTLGFVQTHPYAVKNEENRSKGWICFPRVYGDQVRAIKFRSIASKDFSQVKGMDSKTWFNHDTINPFEPILVTEGEPDTCVLEQAGFAAVSVPSAGAKLTPEMKDALKYARAIYLAGDNDGGVGNEYMKQLHKELGENTYVLKWPDGIKDANDYFLKTCGRDTDKFKLAVERLMESARSTPIEGFKNVVEQLRNSEVISSPEKDPDRLHFPWERVDDMAYIPKGNVVIVYASYTATGKTIFITQTAVHEARRGEVVVAWSPEVRGPQYLNLLASQILQLPRNGDFTPEDFHKTADILCRTYAEKVFVDGLWQSTEVKRKFHMRDENIDQPTQFYSGYDTLPGNGPDEKFAFIEEVVKRTGATRFIIDTLSRFVEPRAGENQTQAESRTMEQFEKLVRDYGVIFILIGQSNGAAQEIKELRNNEYGVLRGSKEQEQKAAEVYLLHRRAMPQSGELAPDTHVVAKKGRYRGKGQQQTWLKIDSTGGSFNQLARDDTPATTEPEPVGMF